jgi:hypothetical protein
MPIRMEDDPQDQSGNSGGGDYPTGPRRGSSGGGGGLLSLLPLLFSLFRGKRMFILIAILAIGYFIMNRQGCSGGLLDSVSSLTTGGFLDPREFEKASIYEPLTEDNSRNPLPENVNLQRFAPPVGNQGQQGSCVAWSSAYGARSILEAARTNQRQTVFSPSFLYNQIGLDGCQGSYINRAMEYMTKQGSVTYQQFPYDENDCSRVPDRSLIQEAGKYKMRGYNRLSAGDRNDAIDITAIKQNLAQGAPVVIGMMVGQSFMQNMLGKDVWIPEPSDRNMMGFGGHAMCVVGYDNKKYGGAFLIMNSWGPEWGTNGFAWVRYPEFNYFVREAYGLEPMAKTVNVPLQCEVGLVKVEFDGKSTVTKGNIPLKTSGGNQFSTVSPIKIGSKFKVEIKNSTECYIYVFGKETDGSAYTLFPYPSKEDPAKTKYSAFCGITGYRLFPRDKSMTPDNIGQRDMIGVVVSREELDWYKIQGAINQQPKTAAFPAKLASALGGSANSGIKFSAGTTGAIQLTETTTTGKPVWCVVEIDKIQ